MLRDSVEELKHEKMQYNLTITYRQKHDSSDFPVDFVQSGIMCVKNTSWITDCGETASFANANSVLKLHLCLEKQEQIRAESGLWA